MSELDAARAAARAEFKADPVAQRAQALMQRAARREEAASVIQVTWRYMQGKGKNPTLPAPPPAPAAEDVPVQSTKDSASVDESKDAHPLPPSPASTESTIRQAAAVAAALIALVLGYLLQHRLPFLS